jgi:hypothetical protein
MSAQPVPAALNPTRSRAASAPLLDAVAFQRYEYKYVIPAELVTPIRSFIRPYCDMDYYAEREPENFYTISSLYLDTDGYKTFWDKEQEVPVRFKLRVRTYGERADGPVKFEIKRRFNEVTRKTWVEVPRESWPQLLTAPDTRLAAGLSAASRMALNEFLQLARGMRVAPKMLVEYQRQAFVSRIDRYVRISFDRRLRYQPIREYDFRCRPEVWQLSEGAGSNLVLELKFMTTAPVWLQDMVRTFGLLRRGFSKYCTAVSGSLQTGVVGRHLFLAMHSPGAARTR